MSASLDRGCYGQYTATTVPLPALPGFAAYPGSTATTTMLVVVLEMLAPDFATLFDTSTPM